MVDEFEDDLVAGLECLADEFVCATVGIVESCLCSEKALLFGWADRSRNIRHVRHVSLLTFDSAKSRLTNEPSGRILAPATEAQEEVGAT